MNTPQQNFSTCTFNDISNEVEQKMNTMTEEMARGLHVIGTHNKSVTFFGSARFDEKNPHYKKARALAARISKELGYTIVTGGGPGIMEAGSRGAHDVSGESVGFTIKLPREQITNPYLTEEAAFRYFFARKLAMTYSAEAYVYCPGGFGTLDEFFEILTLVQTEKIECVPIILFGSDFWGPIIERVTETCFAFETIDASDIKHFIITDDEDKVLDIVKNAPIRTSQPDDSVSK